MKDKNGSISKKWTKSAVTWNISKGKQTIIVVKKKESLAVLKDTKTKPTTQIVKLNGCCVTGTMLKGITKENSKENYETDNYLGEIIMGMRIGKLIVQRDNFKVDETYQRPPDAWSNKDKQCFIDTILRNEPVPLFFINEKDEDGKKVNYIVDGQQRINCILDFYDGKIALSKVFSAPELDGKKYKDLPSKLQDKFLDYSLAFKMMSNYDDERVRMIFSRLQRGKALRIGEKLNAKPGKIVEVMRKIANHDFIAKSIGIKGQRYQTYEDVARIMYFEKFGAKKCGTDEINEFFDTYKDLDFDSVVYKKVINVLNYLLKCFPADPGNYQYFNKHVWVLTVYTAISELKDGYALNEKENDVRVITENFHDKVYSEVWRDSDSSLQRFYEKTRGGWSKELIAFRKDAFKEYLILGIHPKELDIKRQISDEEKIAAFAKAGGVCENCGKKLKDYKEAEYHHVELYSEGGETKIDNIMVLCPECHREKHREKPNGRDIDARETFAKEEKDDSLYDEDFDEFEDEDEDDDENEFDDVDEE